MTSTMMRQPSKSGSSKASIFAEIRDTFALYDEGRTGILQTSARDLIQSSTSLSRWPTARPPLGLSEKRLGKSPLASRSRRWRSQMPVFASVSFGLSILAISGYLLPILILANQYFGKVTPMLDRKLRGFFRSRETAETAAKPTDYFVPSRQLQKIFVPQEAGK